MKVLVVGGGGREHTLAWKLSESPSVTQVFVAPGNAGTARLGRSGGKVQNMDLSDTDVPRLLQFAQQEKIDLTVVGPEAPLVAGIVDAFEAAKLLVFGPNKAAAELEGSKVFCKNLLRSAGIPTADYRVFRTAEQALHYLQNREEATVVVKADGLAAGKGVVVCKTRDEAIAAVKLIAQDRAFGAAGDQILIEERLIGEEASLLAITDGQTILTLEAAQDHKRAYDDDKGPNTGGMGAYSPTPVVTPEMTAWVEEHILVPTIHHMKKKGRPFKGVLYAGLMITNQGPKVLEYNVRFGDPECQAILMRLKTDLFTVLHAAARGKLETLDPLEWDPRPSVCVVMASEGYPGPYERGQVIHGLDDAAQLPDVQVFHAGTASSGPQSVSNGGRVLGVTALGDSLPQAKLQAYKAVKCIRWNGAWCRKDISDKALAYEMKLRK